MKRMLGLALALTMLFSLAACGEKESLGGGEVKEGLCYELTGISPDAVAMTVDGVEVPMDMYFYNICLAAAYMESYLSMYGMDFDTLIDYWSDDIQDPAPFMEFVFDFDQAAGFDTNFQQPDDMVALNDQANLETDVEKRKDLYRQIQEGFAEQAVWIPIMALPWQNAVRNDVSGFVQTPLGNYRFAQLTKTA